MSKNREVHYNVLIKAVIGSLVLNIVIATSMILQNIMFYNKNYGGFNQSINQTVMVNSENTEDKININSCSYEALENLKGIGPKKACSIINNRPYKDKYELKKVVGDSTFDNIKDYITT